MQQRGEWESSCLNSDHNNVTGNTAFNNTLDGINLTNSSWVTVYNNTAYDNHENGIGVYQSHDVNLHVEHGLQQHLERHPPDQVTHSNVTGNNASYNGLSGINLTNSNWTSLVNNVATTTRRTA